ncbi:MAG: adenosine deaminase [Longimicrobiaceae bacterium]
MNRRFLARRLAALSLALLPALAAPAPARAQAAGREAAAAAALERLRGSPPRLYAFLREMPKGGDLHSHLSGAVYAESFIRWAVEDGLCISRRALSIVYPPCTFTADTVAADSAYSSQALYDALVDAWSMRNWNAARISGHDQFFNTFGKFGATYRRVGDELAEAAHRASEGRVGYLELMQTADGGVAASLGARVLGPNAFAPGTTPDFAAYRQALLQGGLANAVAAGRQNLTSVEARRDTVLRCRTAQADPGCAVEVRWLYQVARGRPPQQVFAQILTGFELAKADPRVVGFNLVMPEDGRISMRDFTLHMQMIDALHRYYPDVRISLHAGELAPGLVPPEGMRFHIRQSVELGHASRIGHGVDVLYEDRPQELMREMARRGVLVEIALTSNDGILGIRGKDHPLAAYRAAGVPTALATDDEGVARSEMTREWVKAVEEQGLGYRDLKAMARASLEHAFVEGASLWRDGRSFVPVAACAPAAGGFAGSRCAAFAASSTRARLQRDLELGFRDFEARQ